MSKEIFVGEPDFVNEVGVKWWKDESTTRYAQRADIKGTKLENVVCFAIEEANGHRTRVLVSQEQGVLCEDRSLEGIACKIDVLKVLKRDGVKNQILPSVADINSKRKTMREINEKNRAKTPRKRVALG